MDLMKKRLEAAREHWRGLAEGFVAGKTTADALVRASQNTMKAQQEMTDSVADHLRILEGHFGRMRVVHEVLEGRFKAGKNTIYEVMEAAFARYDAEIALERFKARLPKDGAKGEVTKSLFEGLEVDRQP
jgi:hypothetical protein